MTRRNASSSATSNGQEMACALGERTPRPQDDAVRVGIARGDSLRIEITPLMPVDARTLGRSDPRERSTDCCGSFEKGPAADLHRLAPSGLEFMSAIAGRMSHAALHRTGPYRSSRECRPTVSLLERMRSTGRRDRLRHEAAITATACSQGCVSADRIAPPPTPAHSRSTPAHSARARGTRDHRHCGRRSSCAWHEE
jgi:hypothetical protein